MATYSNHNNDDEFEAAVGANQLNSVEDDITDVLNGDFDDIMNLTEDDMDSLMDARPDILSKNASALTNRARPAPPSPCYSKWFQATICHLTESSLSKRFTNLLLKSINAWSLSRYYSIIPLQLTPICA